MSRSALKSKASKRAAKAREAKGVDTTHQPKTREGEIAKAFFASLDELTPFAGKHASGTVMRKETWRVIRKRVPGVTQAAVTRAILKMGRLLDWKRAYEKRLGRKLLLPKSRKGGA